MRRVGVRPRTSRTCRTAHCVRCTNCDGFPCASAREIGCGGARSPARTRARERHAAHQRGKLVRLQTSASGFERDRGRCRARRRDESVSPPTSSWSRAALRTLQSSCSCSANDTHPNGLAQRLGSGGTRATTCSTTARRCSRFRVRRTRGIFQKTRGLNDFDFANGEYEYPLGNIQMVGKSQGSRCTAGRSRGETRLAPEWTLERGRKARDRLLALDRGSAAAGQPRHRRQGTASWTLVTQHGHRTRCRSRRSCTRKLLARSSGKLPDLNRRPPA